jgi:hypothetical protein
MTVLVVSIQRAYIFEEELHRQGQEREVLFQEKKILQQQHEFFSTAAIVNLKWLFV